MRRKEKCFVCFFCATSCLLHTLPRCHPSHKPNRVVPVGEKTSDKDNLPFVCWMSEWANQDDVCFSFEKMASMNLRSASSAFLQVFMSYYTIRCAVCLFHTELVYLISLGLYSNPLSIQAPFSFHFFTGDFCVHRRLERGCDLWLWEFPVWVFFVCVLGVQWWEKIKLKANIKTVRFEACNDALTLCSWELCLYYSYWQNTSLNIW